MSASSADLDGSRSARKLVAIVGTNASGKSELAVRLAADVGGEVVSADSRQVYRGLDLGAGKLAPPERHGIPHHLIDVATLGDPFSLADYQRLAYEAIEAILRRGNIPVLVGGTGLYTEAVIDGYELVAAPPDPAERQRLEAMPADALGAELARLDPIAASEVPHSNPRRLIRAIEIARAGFAYEDTRRRRPRYDVLQLGLTWPLQVLDARIQARLLRRIDAGMIGEVEALLADGVDREVLDALGLEYRHVLRYLEGEYESEAELAENLGRAIRRFARRQLSWFRRDGRIVWLDTSGDHFDEARTRTWAFLLDTAQSA